MDNPKYEIEIWPSKPELKWLRGLGTLLLSYNCQITLLYVRAEFRHKTKKRIRKVFRLLIIIECLFYVLICLAGYTSLGKNLLNPIFTLRRPISKLVTLTLAPESPDYLMKFTQLLFTGAAAVHVPITMFPGRE